LWSEFISTVALPAARTARGGSGAGALAQAAPPAKGDEMMMTSEVYLVCQFPVLLSPPPKNVEEEDGGPCENTADLK